MINRETTVTLADMCLLLNLGDSRVGTLAKQGILIKTGKNAYKLVDSIQNYIDYVRGDTDSALTLQEERAKLVHYQSEKARLELEHLKGLLVDAEEVKAEAIECAIKTRDAMLNIPERLFNRGVIDVSTYNVLIKEIEEALNRL